MSYTLFYILDKQHTLLPTEVRFLFINNGYKCVKTKRSGVFNRFFGFILTFVYESGIMWSNNDKKTMQIHNNTLIAECSAYDFKEMLERKKVKSWLKSVSAFANTDGGSLFYRVNDDGVIVGLKNPQADADFISENIKARLDPVPEIQLIPIEHEGYSLLEVKVKAGILTPYYYYQDGTRTAYTRVGNESVECNSQQLLSLVLKGTHMTWDSLPTQVNASKHSFIILANTFREQTRQEWNDKYLESFGLVTPDGKLTNAGLLFVDNCTVFQSRIFCTRWTGLYKDDAISSVEHRTNLVLLLNMVWISLRTIP